MSGLRYTPLLANGPKNARLETRIPQSMKKLIQVAASLNGVDVSSFVNTATFKEAQATIRAHEVTILASEADRKAFFAALENPPEPTERLKSAFALRKKLIANAD